jgi:hypothetical protein
VEGREEGRVSGERVVWRERVRIGVVGRRDCGGWVSWVVVVDGWMDWIGRGGGKRYHLYACACAIEVA